MRYSPGVNLLLYRCWPLSPLPLQTLIDPLPRRHSRNRDAPPEPTETRHRSRRRTPSAGASCARSAPSSSAGANPTRPRSRATYLRSAPLIIG
jgi:hypothetical protein